MPSPGACLFFCKVHNLHARLAENAVRGVYVQAELGRLGPTSLSPRHRASYLGWVCAKLDAVSVCNARCADEEIPLIASVHARRGLARLSI